MGKEKEKQNRGRGEKTKGCMRCYKDKEKCTAAATHSTEKDKPCLGVLASAYIKRQEK